MSRMRATADLLADPSYTIDDITVLALVDVALRKMVNQQVDFALVADNKDRPDLKYGTNPDGSPMFAPEWYMAQSISTGIHESLYSVLRRLLSCEEVDEHGHKCTGGLGHASQHWDGSGCNWVSVDA